MSVEDTRDLASAVKQAEAIARALGPGPVRLAPVPVIQAVIPGSQLGRAPDQVSLDEKIALTQAYAEMLCRTDISLDTQVHYQDAAQTQWLVTSEGSAIVQPWATTTMEFEASARDGWGIHRAVEELGGTANFDDLRAKEAAVIEAARRVTSLSSAVQLSSGNYDVICDGALTGLLAHEVVGHLLEADVVGSSVEHMMHLRPGTGIGWEGLTVVDDPTVEAGGHYRYDDEGVAGKRTVLIDKGKVGSYLHSRQTAAHFGATPTGHAQAVGYTAPPLVRMSNTFVAPGEVSLDSLFDGVRRGIYARGTRGAIGGRHFALEPQEARLIEHGNVTGYVRGVRLHGDAFTTLRAVDAVADDFRMFNGGRGGCYKNGQGPSRSVSGGPHIRLRSLWVEGDHGIR